ncbi:penicillin-binding transpeptidase domain-containing protein [Myxococcaceae bacterium GXIMD 01537]
MFSRRFPSWFCLSLVLLLSGCHPRTGPRSFPGAPESEARAYLGAWADNDLTGQRAVLAEAPSDFDTQHTRWRQGLGIAASRFELLGIDSEREDTAVVSFRGVHTLRGLGDWTVESRLSFERRQGRWRLRWTPAVLHPEARAGDRFTRQRAWAPRAALLDADGEPLTVQGEVISVGVQPARVVDPVAVTETLQNWLGVEPTRVEVAMKRPSAQPEGFVGIVDVRPERYQQVRPVLAPVPGIFFRKKTARLTPAEGFASHTLGRVGEVTAEALEALGVPYQAGDVVGLSGLERAVERRLAGRPSGEVRLTRASGESVVLYRFEGEEGRPVRTTLRRSIQAAAEDALSDVLLPAALVAVEADSGKVLAVVSRPLGEPLHRAMTGRYPPGSTFKVVTAEALLDSGMKPDARVTCPAEAPVDGKRFRNFEGEVLGNTTLRRAFALSCNTTFILLGAQLDSGALATAARRFGFGVGYDAGLPSPGASFPEPRNDAERAAAAIGQGRVLATPLHMASVAAAVGSGVWHAPRLLADSEGGPDEHLPRGTPEALRELMRAVVTEGSGRAASGIPGLVGKTGTAEFGKTLPLQTHAWFIGVHDGIGFAVFVEGGGVGGRVAVPIAARFVEALRRAP